MTEDTQSRGPTCLGWRAVPVVSFCSLAKVASRLLTVSFSALVPCCKCACFAGDQSNLWNWVHYVHAFASYKLRLGDVWAHWRAEEATILSILRGIEKVFSLKTALGNTEHVCLLLKGSITWWRICTELWKNSKDTWVVFFFRFTLTLECLI